MLGCVLLGGASVCGQPSKGDWMIGIGGSMNFGKPRVYTIPAFESDTSAFDKKRYSRLTVQGGYSLSDHWQIGISLGYDRKKHEIWWREYVLDDGERVFGDQWMVENYKQKTFFIGPYARYFYRVNEIFSLGLKGGIDFSSGNTTEVRITRTHRYRHIVSYRYEMKTFGVSSTVTPEFWLNVTSKLGINVSVFEVGHYFWKWDQKFIDTSPGGGTRKDSVSEFRFHYARFGLGITYNL